MMFLIVGRTGRGKDTLKDILQNHYGWNFVKSYATRPKRTSDEDTHVFITPEEASAIPKEDMLAYTKIGDYEYFVTKDMLDGIDAYVIDPNGVKFMNEALPDKCFHVIYIQSDDEEAEKHAIMRGDPEIERQRFKARTAAENEEFSDFEQFIDSPEIANTNLVADKAINNYTETFMLQLADELERIRLYYQNMQVMLQTLLDTNFFKTDENGLIQLQFSNEEKPVSVTKERMAQMLLQPNHHPTLDVFLQWISTPGVNLVESGNIITDTVGGPELVERLLTEPLFQSSLKTFNIQPDPNDLYKDIISSESFQQDYKDLFRKHISCQLLIYLSF